MEGNVGILLARRSKLTPDEPGLIVEGETFTYRQINERSNCWAHAFRDFDARKGDRVGILLKNCNEFLEAYFGLAKMGALIVPIDWRLAPTELEYVLKDSGPVSLIFDAELTRSVEGIKPNLSVIDYIRVGPRNMHVSPWAKDSSLIADYPSSEPKLAASGEDPLFILYTAGTTGYPNGAVITHQNHFLTCRRYSKILSFRQGQRVLLPLPLFHGFGLAYVTSSIHAGCMNVLLKRFDPIMTLRTIQTERIETFPAAPTMLQRIAQVPSFEKYMNSVRFVTSGGAPLPVRLISVYAEHAIKIRNLYGLTEGGPVSATSLGDAIRKAGSTGLPVFHNEVRIVDENGIQLPAGEVGEILVKGPTIMTEYWKNPQATRETIKEGWVYTGDLGYLDKGGYLYIVDRKRDRIISGGEKIYPAEIENVLCAHPKIIEAAAVGLPDEIWGEVVCAVACAKPGETLTPKEVIDFCQGKLAHFKTPKRVLLVDPPLPRNTAGKLLRRVIREQLSTTK